MEEEKRVALQKELMWLYRQRQKYALVDYDGAVEKISVIISEKEKELGIEEETKK